MTYNIRHGRGVDDRVDLERTAAVLRALEPDIVALQEVDSAVRRSGGVDQAAELAGVLGMRHAFGGFFAYQGGQYGMAVLSRHPVTGVHSIRLPEGNEPRIALAVGVNLRGTAVRVVNVHFDWVENDSFRFRQASALAAVLDTASVPWVLLGDFNDQPGSRTMRLFAQRASEARKPPEDRLTFPSTQPLLEIDFVFVSPPRAWARASARVVVESVASDHRPVLAELLPRP